MPDTEIPITLSKEAFESLINLMIALYSDLTANNVSAIQEIIYIIKLLIHQC